MEHNIAHLNPSKITKDGVYFDIDNGCMFRMTPEEIRKCRLYFRDETIASNVVIMPVRKEAPKKKVTKSSPYKSYKGRVPKGARTKKVVLGVVVAATIFSSYSLLTHANKVEPVIEETGQVIMEEYGAESNLKLEVREKVLVKQEQDDEITKERKEIVRKYCNVYQVDFDKVYAKLVEVSENFKSEAFKSGTLPNVTCKGANVEATSEEELILYFVRACYHMPERFNFDDNIELENSGFISNFSTPGEAIYAYSKLLHEDPCLTYAIVQSECGFNSKMYNEINNPAGLKLNGKWWEFNTKDEGFIELVLELLKYRRMGASTIEEIGAIHAPVDDGNEYWVSNVKAVYNEVSSDMSRVFRNMEDIDAKMK